MFAFDYQSTGKLDHLVIYRPGSGIFWILENTGTKDASNNTVYVPVYQSGDPSAGTNGIGIGTYPLLSTADLAFAFDYEGSGKLDDLVLYQPGSGIFCILQNASGPGNTRTFSKVFPVAGSTTPGIGGYNLASPADLAFAFDYEGSGMLDDLVLYRPGTQIIWILQGAGAANARTYTIVYPAIGSVPDGIGNYDLKWSTDRVFAFDYESNGMLDDLVLYRPGMETLWILQAGWTGAVRTYTRVFPAPGSTQPGIANYDLASPLDQVFAFDYAGTGLQDHLVLYQPGAGTIWIIQNDGGGSFSVALEITGDAPLAGGLGGFDLCATVDRVFPFDYASSGKLDYLVFYRPGTGAVSILKNNHTSPDTFDNSPFHVGLSAAAQVQLNLANIRALNSAIFNENSNLVSQAYLLLTEGQSDNADWLQTTGLQLFAGAFWGIAGAVGTITDVWPIVAAAAGFIASFVPGMVTSLISSGGTGMNSSIVGLLKALLNSNQMVDGKLSLLQADPVGNWTIMYNNMPLSALANSAFPTAGVTYNTLVAEMTAALNLQIWQAIVQTNYVITRFPSHNFPQEPLQDYYTDFYLKNPAYYIYWIPAGGGTSGTLYVENIGTGVSGWYPVGGDGGMKAPACQPLFSQYARSTIFQQWNVPPAPYCPNVAPPKWNWPAQ
jgi:hypothetical protein